jgi:exonuclease 3'-5' domain-containing protein 1
MQSKREDTYLQNDLLYLKEGFSNMKLKDNKTIFVDNLKLCKEVSKIILQKKILAFDLEGIDLSRNGEICIINFTDKENTWLIDVCAIGSSCFQEGGLKEIFSSKNIKKIIFDGRSDCDALYHLFGITVNNIIDIQVMYVLNKRNKLLKFLPGYSRALEEFLDYNEKNDLNSIKQKGRLLFAPELGGDYDVWKQRPLSDILLEYCEADMKYLFRIYEKLSNSLIKEDDVVKISESRIKEILALNNLWPRGPKSKWTEIRF